jgi:hypothetical protein
MFKEIEDYTMLSNEEYDERYPDREDKNLIVKLAANIVHELEVHLNPKLEEYANWRITSDPKNHRLYALSTYYLKNKDKLLIISEPFCWLSLEGMVSHQMKAVKMRIAEIKLALAITGLDKAVKFVPDVVQHPNAKIQKNKYYDEVSLPYKYFSNKSIELRFTVDLELLDPLRYGYFKTLGFPLTRSELLQDNDYVID